MPKKICNHCGRIYEFECECRKKRRKFSKTKDIYNSTRWKKVSKKIRARDFYCDRFALFLSVCDASKLPTWTRPFKTFLTLPDGTIRRMNDILLVHHIEPVDENSSSWFDENNLISLYQSTHEMIHKLYETELKNEVQSFLKKIVSSNVF